MQTQISTRLVVATIPPTPKKFNGRGKYKRDDSKVIAKQLKVYNFILDYKKNHDGCSPSLRNIMDEIGITSTSVARFYLLNLVKASLITFDINTPRSIQVVGGVWSMQDDSDLTHDLS